jgi:hypothetical protein
MPLGVAHHPVRTIERRRGFHVGWWLLRTPGSGEDLGFLAGELGVGDDALRLQAGELGQLVRTASVGGGDVLDMGPSSVAISPSNWLPGNPTMMYWNGPIVIAMPPSPFCLRGALRASHGERWRRPG